MMGLESKSVVTVSVLLKYPGLPTGLKLACIKPDLPGATGSFDQSGVVHPQDACTLIIFTCLLLLFKKVNSCITGPPCSLIDPKSKISSLKCKGLAIWPKEVALKRKQTIKNFIRIILFFLNHPNLKLIRFSFILFSLHYGENSYRYTKQRQTPPWKFVGCNHTS